MVKGKIINLKDSSFEIEKTCSLSNKSKSFIFIFILKIITITIKGKIITII